MAYSINKVQLIGNLGKDPEIKAFDSGNKRASLAIATSKSYKDKNGQRIDKTVWHNAVAWGSLADICEKYLRKGGQVYIEGELDNRSYEDSSGHKKYITEINVRELGMLDKPVKSQNNE